MPLREYLRRIQDSLDSLPAAASYSLTFDERSPQAAFLHGRIVFTDGSTPYFKEFLLAAAQIRKLKYGYHWAAQDGSLRFRYDNGSDPAAMHLATFPHHKHTPAGIEAAKEPALVDLLTQIADLLSRV